MNHSLSRLADFLRRLFFLPQPVLQPIVVRSNPYPPAASPYSSP